MIPTTQNFQRYIPLILALPGLGDTHTRNSEIHLTVSPYSLAGCEPVGKIGGHDRLVNSKAKAVTQPFHKQHPDQEWCS